MTTLLGSPFSSMLAPVKPGAPGFDAILSASGSAFMAVFNPHESHRDVTTLRDGVAKAERLLASAEAVHGQFREGIALLSVTEIKRELAQFGAAWPNASRADLAGYGLQLLADVEERQPCRYALRAALRHLRQTSKFLPSIAEVLAALDDAQSRISNTLWHLQQLPAALEHARADLAKADARERRQAQGAAATDSEGP